MQSPHPVQSPKYLSGSDLAARFHRSRRTIDRWVEENGFPKPALAGRGVPTLWHASDVEKWEAVYLTAPATEIQ